MFSNIALTKDFPESRKIENIIIKLSTRDKYIIEQYQQEMEIDNRSSWLIDLIENDINEKLDSGFVVIK